MRPTLPILVLSALLIAGCSSDPAPPEVVRAESNNGGAAGTAGAAGAGGGTAGSNAGGEAGAAGKDDGGKGNEVTYPAGPYGLEVGSVVQNFKFSGLRNPAAVEYSTAAPEVIAFSDFYNPDYSDETKPKALVVTASARWCTFCKSEAQKTSGASGYHAYWKPKGVEFFTTLFDNETPGQPADYIDLEKWTKAYKVEFPMALDPNPPQLGVFFKLDAAPFNMVIDTATMKILFKTEGEVNFGPTNTTLKKVTGG